MKSISAQNIHESLPEKLPVIPTMDVVVFPQMIVPLLVLDERIIKGINHALDTSKLVMLLATKKQTSDAHEAIGTKDLYSVGTVASIMRLIKIPEGGVKVLVQGMYKASVDSITTEDNMLYSHISHINSVLDENDSELRAQIKNIKELAEKMAASGQSFSPDFHIIISKMQDPQKIADFVLSHLNVNVEEAQNLLEKSNHKDFLQEIYMYMSRELEVAEVQERIKNLARESMNKAQKEFYLREQLKAIKKELGEDDLEDIEKMRAKLSLLPESDEIRTEVIRQINRLESTSADSMEAAVIRNYLDWVFHLPWTQLTEDNLDIRHAKEILDQDHYGLGSIKERILDFISIRNLKQDGHTPIICFVGPPGTGKTSLGASIAKSLGREYVRVALGGVKDEAEIRGHRRTYVGAMPGRFIQGLRKVKSRNPVLVIDELDKLGSDFRGDPSAALLELLDPQQNHSFYDNYMGVPFDLSKILFIATANSLDTIPGPLRDRMEIIELSGYSLDEKLRICTKYIVNRARKATGLENHDISFSDDLIKDIIANYTHESGVRQLERTMKDLCSKAARSFVENGVIPEFSSDNIENFLGPRRFLEDEQNHIDQVGITNGLAWTAYGGEMIKIEAVLMPGRGKLTLTGQLGNVMKESAQAALSYARAHATEFNVDQSMFNKYDLHIHVPAGSIPKDGPSAGITILSSILSAYTKKPINAQYAMTGELNLQGEVMPIGGVKEKVLAAKRNKFQYVILPSKNKNDLKGAEDVTKDIDIIWVDHANEVLQRVLVDLPQIAKKRA
jgi:ATP-dependent Lon protease